MIRSLVLLQQTDHGFRPDHVLTVRISVATRTQPRAIGKYDTRPQQMAYYREILNRVKMLPGITAAAIVNNLPLSGINTSLTFDLGEAGNESSARTISPEYFAVMRIPIIYGVVAYTSNLRAHEVGIRMALGATANNVLAVIMRGAMIPIFFGVSLSAVATLLLSSLLRNLLYEVSSGDPVTYLGAGALLLAIGAIASVLPAWHAPIRDPLQTLRFK